MRIGVTCYPTVGGSGILATRLGVEFAKSGHEVHFITYERPVAIQDIDIKNVHVHLVTVVEYPLFKYPPYTVALSSEMFRVSQQYELDLLHVHYSLPHSTAAFLAREITGIPYIVTLHGSDVTILGSDPSYMPINTYTVENADAVTAVSKFMMRESHERLGLTRKVKVIPNFVDYKLFSPAPCNILEKNSNRDVVISHISNFRPVKRIQDLVRAMGIVLKRAPEVKLMLVGDGPERHRIERLIEKLGIHKNVLLTGFRSDVANILKCSDVTVLCSETESAPLTLLEGMSSGLPVIATRVGGIPEIIQDNVNGLLVNVKDPEAIANRIIELNDDLELRRNLGEAARLTVLEKYSAEKVICQYEKVFSSIL